MSWFGKLLSVPVKLVNAPIRAAENIIEHATGGDDRMDEEDRIMSKPLKAISDEIERL